MMPVKLAFGFAGSAERIEEVDMENALEPVAEFAICDLRFALSMMTLLVAMLVVPFAEIVDLTRTDTLPDAEVVEMTTGGWLTPFTLCSMRTFADDCPFVTFPPEFPPEFAETETLFETLTVSAKTAIAMKIQPKRIVKRTFFLMATYACHSGISSLREISGIQEFNLDSCFRRNDIMEVFERISETCFPPQNAFQARSWCARIPTRMLICGRRLTYGLSF